MVSQMYGWMDGRMDSVSLRYSFLVSQMEMDECMDGKC